MKNSHLEIISLLKEYNAKFGLLTESKLDILINKIGLNEKTAELFDNICGKVSVFLANKLLDSYYKEAERSNQGNINTKELKKETLNFLNKNIVDNGPIRNSIIEQLTSIMEYITVGLNNRFDHLKPLNYAEILDEAIIWEQSVKEGKTGLNYKENEDKIIKDFRDKNGLGYYWIDLDTNYSTDECERMLHCGRSTSGKLYSLRSYQSRPNGKTYNRSHLTAAIENGIIYQLKGVKNSKPKQEYHKYILPLFDLKYENGQNFINKFENEFNTGNDFKLEDLSDDDLISLYKKRPDLFKSAAIKTRMNELGYETKLEPETYFEIDLEPNEVSRYIFNDFLLDSKSKYYLSEALLMNDVGTIYNLFSNFPVSWKLIFHRKINEENKQFIKDILTKIGEKNNSNVDGMNLEIMIETLDFDDEIRTAIEYSYRLAITLDYFEKCFSSLAKTLKQYGNDVIFNPIRISGNISNLVDMDDKEVIDIYETTLDYLGQIDTTYVVNELIKRKIIRPPFWNRPTVQGYKTLNVDEFNSLLSDELYLIEDKL